MTNKVPTTAMIDGHKRGAKKRIGHKGWNKGLTKETSESVKLQSQKMTGKNSPNYGKPPWNKGLTKYTNESLKRQSEKVTGRTKYNDEGMRKISETLTGRTKETDESVKRHSEKLTGRTGSQASNWQGGKSYEPYCPKFNEEFRERVRIFFGRKCVLCGSPENGKKLCVHHVNYDKMVCCNDIKPLFVCLCKKCHSKTQKDREGWQEFFEVSLAFLTDNKCFYTKEEMNEINKKLCEGGGD